MENLKIKIDQKRRGLEALILHVTLTRKGMLDAFKFAEADKLEKTLEFMAEANNNLFMSALSL